MSDQRVLQLWWKMPGDGADKIWTLEPDSNGETTFHLAPFASSNSSPILEITGNKKPVFFPLNAHLDLVPSPTVSGAKKQDHLNTVNAAIEAIRSEELEKVVVSRSEFWTTPLAPERLFQSKCEMYPDAMVYLLAHPESGVWLGASPELLLQRRGNEFETVSLAGTKSNLNGEWTEKDRREQELVTDFITHRLRSVGAQGVKQLAAEDRKYGAIQHLESRILFSSAVDEASWLKELHPTPAVGGAPRNKALEFIETNEIQDRGYYTGYLGWSQKAESNYFVNLRCMQCFADGFRLFAGGGIVSGSDAVGEWEETQAKIETIRTNLKP